MSFLNSKWIGGIILLILFLLVLKFRKNAESFENKKCSIEVELAFDGIITNYQTDVLREESKIELNHSKVFLIPRSYKELQLVKGDSVVKIYGTHIYLVKHDNYDQNIDTTLFECVNN